MSLMVIDVSSRENSPTRNNPRGSKPRTRTKRAAPPGDVIELTDSDPEEVRPGPSRLQGSRRSNSAAASQRRKEKRRAEPVAGPSGVRDAEPPRAAARAPTPPLPLFLPDFDDPFNLMAHFHAHQPAPAAPAPAPVPVAPALAPAAGPAAPLADLEPDPAPLVPEPEMIMDEDIPYDAYVAQVLEIIPDVLAAHVFSLVEQHYPNAKDKVVETVLHVLFENPDYPKADAKGKRKREEPQAERVVRPKIDYGNKHRVSNRSAWYTPLALEHLEAEFPDIPTTHIRKTFQENNILYAPTYLALLEQQRSGAPPYKAMARPRHKGKGKHVQKHDGDLEHEIQWVREKLDEDEARRVAEVEDELKVEEEGGIECGCCFSEYPFDKMVQCPEAHLFCTTCMMSYAETKLGEHDAKIVCMDQSGCKLPFPDSELRRFLSPKLLELYERVKQRKEIEAAGLEGLEECPFCEYKVVIENENERLFRCENEACGAVTCRQCKKLDHLPKSCQEVDDDKKLGVRHAIEEAMTAALMRNCPKCNKAFIKEMGCNKMTCPNCGTLSCYICRKVIVGYDHFAHPPPYEGRPDSKKCTLWDASVEGRHSDEVTAAAKRALEEYKRTHPEFDEKDIAVDLPPPPPAGPSHPAHPHGVGLGRGPRLPVPQVHIPPPLPRLPRLGRLPPPAHPDPFGLAAAAALRDHAADFAAHAHRHRRQPAQVVEYQHQHHHAAPVFNVQVHINQPPAQAGPAYPQPAPMLPQAPVFQPPPNLPPMPMPMPMPLMARARAPLAPPRRSARKRAGR